MRLHSSEVHPCFISVVTEISPSVLVLLGALGCKRLPRRLPKSSATERRAEAAACPGDDSGLKLPAGFCATIFANGVGHARHLAVAPNGVVYVNTWSGRYYGNDKPPHAGGFLVDLQGPATVAQERPTSTGVSGETVQSGGAGGAGIGLYKGGLFAEINDKIVRYALPAGSAAGSARTLQSQSSPDCRSAAITPCIPSRSTTRVPLYIDVATATNACQAQNRTPKSPGIDPCTELETRGGIWRYDANKTNQAFSPALERLRHRDTQC